MTIIGELIDKLKDGKELTWDEFSKLYNAVSDYHKYNGRRMPSFILRSFSYLYEHPDEFLDIVKTVEQDIRY